MGLRTAVWIIVTAAGLAATAQTSTAAGSEAASKATQGAPQSTAQKFPYPSESPSAGSTTEAPAANLDAPQPAASPTTAGGKGDSAAKRFPYPGETDTGTASKANVPDAPPASEREKPPATDDWSSSSGSGAGEPADSANGPLKDAGSSGEDTTPVRQTRRRKLDKPPHVQTTEERVAEDLDVAQFYQGDGNFKAAYVRAKDAVSLKPEDPYAHFALAEAARKLGKSDEAREEYAAVLKLDATPKQQKASQKALSELAVVKK